MHQAALHINGDYVPQTVRRFAGNVFGADLVSVQAQHPHLGEVAYVDRSAKAAQGEVCKMQERSQCWTFEEKTISNAEILKVPIIRSHLKNRTLYDSAHYRLVFSKKLEK